MLKHFYPISLERIADMLCEKKKTLIIFHVRPDADAVGSAFALRELLRIMDVPVYCACSDEVPERLQFLCDGTQGSVLIDDDFALDYERVVSVDSASPSQLGSLYVRLHKDVDLMIDHHAFGTPYANNYIDPDAAATGEIIYELAKILKAKGRIAEIPERTLNCIFAAISSDTGGFRFSNTTPRIMRIAAELMEKGVDVAALSSLLYDSKPLTQLRAEGAAIERVRIYENGKIASVLFPFELKQKLGAASEHLDSLIDIARSICGVEVAFVVKQMECGGPCRISIRSTGNVDVAEICALFGGGGHRCAAGCTLNVDCVEDAEGQILEVLFRKMNNN